MSMKSEGFGPTPGIFTTDGLPNGIGDRGSKQEPMKFGGLSKFAFLSSKHKTMSANAKKRKQASARKLIAELGSESNAHGLAKIATSMTTKRKVLWSLLVIIGFTAATLQLSSLVQKFLSYQVVEVSNMKEGMPVEFPSVTICNIATISMAKVNRLIENGSRMIDWLQLLDETNFGAHKHRMETPQALFENLQKEATAIGHSIDNFVVSCRFNQKDCGPANFSLFFDGKNYYNCYTFNSGYDESKGKPKDDKLLMHTTGPQNGLSLIISLDNENPTPGGYGIYQLHNHIAFSAGVRAQVHAPNTMPSPADHGFDVPPGYSTSVGLKAIIHSRLPHPHGNCTYNNLQAKFRKYRNTMFSCFQLCKQKFLVKECGCKTAALPMYRETDPKLGNISFCGTIKNWQNKAESLKQKEKVELKHLMCESKMLENLNNDRSYEKKCGCFQPCQETAYQKSLSFSYWPLEFYQYSALQELYINKKLPFTTELIAEAYEKLDSLQDRYGPYQGHHVEYNVSDLNDKIRASELIRQNLIRLNIYLEDLSIVEFLQMPAYEITDLFADIGGTLGLWMGISVLTIMELVELILSLLMLLFNSESDTTGSEDEQEEHQEKQTMLDQQNNGISESNSKYDHFQYDRPLFNHPFDRHAESPI